MSGNNLKLLIDLADICDACGHVLGRPKDSCIVLHIIILEII